MTQSLNKSSRALVLDLINADNSQNFAESDFVWGSPVAITGRSDGRNTALEISAASALGFVGSQTMFYNRLDLTQLFNEVTLSFEDNAEAYTNTSDIVALINIKYDLAMDESDVVYEPLVRVGDAPYTFTLTAKTDSYAYLGQVNVSLVTTPQLPTGDENYFATGFYFANTVDGKFGPSYQSLTSVVDTDLPLVQPTDERWSITAVLASGGYQNELFGLTANSDGVSTDFHYSLDGGETWGIQNIPDIILSADAANSVFFKGYCYFIGKAVNGAWTEMTSVYRVRPPAVEGGEYLFERMLDGQWFTDIVADENSLAVVAAYEDFVHISNDGVAWAKETLPIVIYAACFHQNKFVAWGQDDTAAGFLAVRDAADVYTAKPFTNFDTRGNWGTDDAVLFSTDDTRLSLLVSTYTYAEVSEFHIGDLLQTVNFGDTWTFVLQDSGVVSITDPLDNGPNIILLGLTTSDYDEPVSAKMAVSTDRAVSFTVHTQANFSMLPTDVQRTIGVVLRQHKGSIPAVVELPAVGPTYLMDRPSSLSPSNGVVQRMEEMPNGNVLLFGNFDSVDGGTRQAITVLDGNGIEVDYPNWAVDITNVRFAAVSKVDNGMYVVDRRSTAGAWSGINKYDDTMAPDLSFTCPAFTDISGVESTSAFVSDLVALLDGKILVCGGFYHVNGNESPYIARLNADGSFDSTFVSPYMGSTVGSAIYGPLKLLSNGQVVYTFFDGADHGPIILNADGTKDTVMSKDLPLRVSFAHLFPNGNILVYGPPSFPTPAGWESKTTVLLYPDGTYSADTPSTSLNESTALCAYDENRLVAVPGDGTPFGSGQGRSIQNFIYVLSDGSIVESDITVSVVGGSGGTGELNSLLRQSSGPLLVSGYFEGAAKYPYPRYDVVSRSQILRIASWVDPAPAGAVTTINASMTGDMVDATDNLLTTDSYGDQASNGSFFQQEGADFLIGLRVYEDWNWVSDSNSQGVYDLTGVSVNEDPAWFITIVAKAASGTILDNYDMQLLVRNMDTTDPAYVLDVVNNGGTWTLENTTDNVSLPINYVNGSIIQTEFKASDIASQISDNLSNLWDLVEWAFNSNGYAYPFGNFQISLQLTRKTDQTLAANAVVVAAAPGVIVYPYNQFNVAINDAYLDGSDMLLMDAASPNGNWALSENETVEAAVRALLIPATPVVPTTYEAFDRQYTIANIADNNNEWFLDIAIRDKAGTSLVGRVLKISMNAYDAQNDWWTTFCRYIAQDVGGTLTFVDELNFGIDKVPDYIAIDDTMLQMRLNMHDFIDNRTGDIVQDGTLCGDLKITVNVDDGEADMEIRVVASQYEAAVAFVAEGLTGQGGDVVFVDSGSMKVTADKMFTSAATTEDVGYLAEKTRYARIVDSTLMVDLDFDASGMGFASAYSGTLEDITLYGCDPETGATVETNVLGNLAWDYSSTEFDLTGLIGVLNPALSWRGSLKYNLVSDSGDAPVNSIIDFAYFKSRAVTLVSIDGTPYNQALTPLAAPTGFLRNSLPFELYYGGLTGIAEGPHTAIVSIDGVEKSFDFVMAPGV